MGVRGKGPTFEASCPQFSSVEACGLSSKLFWCLVSRLLCGRASLYPFFHAAIFRRASNKFWNQLLPDILPAAARESSRRARSASAFPVECAPAPSPPPRTTPENGGSSTPVRCHSGSLAAPRALSRPQRLIRTLRAIAVRHGQHHQPARSPLTEGVVLFHLPDSGLQRYELQPFFRITDCNASLSRLRSATSFRSRVFSSRSCFASCAWLTSAVLRLSRCKSCVSRHPFPAPHVPPSARF